MGGSVHASLTILFHSHIKTFLQATVLTFVSGVLVDFTAFFTSAHVLCFRSNTSSEETLACLTAHYTKVHS